MKEITVISGKGGTGKTSITASLAALMGNKAVVTDCDVDAANMHIVMKPEIQKEQIFQSGSEAVIDSDACIKCGKCKEVCRFNAVQLINQKYSIDTIACEGCGYCSRICPAHAIEMQPAIAGKVFHSKTHYNNSFVHARLGIAADNSGKLVTQVRKEAKTLAQQLQVAYLVNDGAPGVGCPVTASITGADYIVLIAEPSVSGVHDVKRVHQLTRQFSIPSGMIINKQGLNPLLENDLKNYCQTENIQLLGSLPFTQDFSKAMNANKTIVEYSDSLRKNMEQILNNLELAV